MQSTKTYTILLATIGILCICNLTVQYLYMHYGWDYLYGFSHFFNFDREANLPTWFSSSMLLVSSLLLWIITRSEGITYKKHWSFLSYIFLFLSLDEAATVHEEIGEFVLYTTGPVFSLTWLGLYPYVFIALLLSYTYTKYLFSLSKRFRFLFVVSGFVFCLGALGFEGLSNLNFNDDELNYPYIFLFTVEETLEMIGVSTFIYALLEYMEEHGIELAIEIKSNSS